MFRSLITALAFCAVFVCATCAAPRSAVGQNVVPEDRVPEIENTKKQRLSEYKRPVVIEFDGPIDNRLHRYFMSRIHKAEQRKADLVILDIDSPGGLLDASLEIADKMSKIEWAHTIAFVEDEAISGAAIVSLGCDEIIVDDDANFGDIGAIWADPSVNAFRYAPEKIVSYLISESTILAGRKGRSKEMVEAMINKDVMVYTKPGLDGERLFKKYKAGSDDEKPADPWKLIEESDKDRFLTLPGARAAELGLADSICGDLKELSVDLKFNPDAVKTYRRNTTDSVVYLLNTPLITGLLILIGLIALYFELSAPGIGVGGLVAGLCVTLFFWSRFLGGTSGWLEVLLFLAGIVFIAMEVFVIPGWGVSGLMGMLLVFFSVLMASQDFVVPQSTRQWNHVISTILVFLCSGAAFLIAAVFITRKFGKLPVLGRMILNPDDPSVTGAVVPTPEFDEDGKPFQKEHPMVSVGDWGRAESMLRPAGRAKFSGRNFDVISDGSLVNAGSQVRVIKIRGNVITVMEVEPEDDSMEKTSYPDDSASA